MSQAVIVSYKRSPFTLANKGALAKTRPDDLAAAVVKALVAESGIDTNTIEDLILGCAFPEGEQGFNIARMVAFLAGLPNTVAGLTVNRWCGSSMEAIHIAAGRVAAGQGDAFICGGVESMTRIPMGGFNPMPNTALYGKYPEAYMSMGLTAEQIQKKYNISREAQEKFALASHQKAAKAGTPKEIVPIETKGGTVTADGAVRADSTLEAMAALKPAFDAAGTVTAATSSPVTDGASAVLVVSEEFARKHKLPILARIKSFAISGLEPELMGMGPVSASKKALDRAGLKVSDMDFVELNEAFAVQAMAVIQELGLDETKLNIDGGAIALGHPLGASGARITGKAAQLLSERGGKYALATACIGGGMGIATVLEKA